MRRSVTAFSLIALVALAHAQPTKGEDESAALVVEGRAALRENRLDVAAKALDQAITLNPRRVDAYVLRSAVFSARKQYKQAVELMLRAQAIAPADIEVLSALGSNQVLAGDAAGVPLLEQVVAKEPARFGAQLLLGHHWHEAGKWPDAIAAYEAYFAHRPPALAREDAAHRIELADAYLRARKPAKALELFEASSRERKRDVRARIGIAWAMAAIDCRKARPLLHELEPIAEAHPELWLVDGQCAIALGDAQGALVLGRHYLDKAPQAAASGHALVGEAYAARGNLADARKELETARTLEPGRRRWSVRLAVVLRRANHSADALDVLDKLGAPNPASLDPDWWVEVGDTLLAMGKAGDAVARLAPAIADLPQDAEVRVVLGAAQLASGHADLAMKVLDEAEAIAPSARGKKLLSEALAIVAVGKLAANDAAGAEPLLARAEQVDATPIVLRDLGIARLQLGKPADALAILDRAARADPSPITQMLDARAHALTGDVAGARPIYERALAADRDNPIEIALDWAASELAGGDPAIAIAALDKTAAAAKTGPLAARHRAALATARHAAGVAALKAGNGAKAVELLRAAAAADNNLRVRCDLALATVVAGDPNAAATALRSIAGQSCPFPPPADTQAAAILLAFTDGLTPRRAGKALDRLTALSGKSTGVAAALLGTAIRVVALNAAQEAYRAGKLAQARAYLTTAKNANARIGGDEIAHDVAVLDLAEGHIDSVIVQLDRVAPRVPEAFVNLGIAYERKGDQARALDAWRRARKLGVRFPQLAEWIETKERIYGE